MIWSPIVLNGHESLMFCQQNLCWQFFWFVLVFNTSWKKRF
ncbi:hypothetical protein EV13_2955 [Prochlorococcus sp. MIT 0702]|nr:hypothetical protein EV12_2902 [Prochlorococcus sp. MIT 0701]KGG26174.1 hypothetical protein EV13_2955 [Prochlorococcus sp. MIT 0702]KGG32998.1 hypothetical protein EV14_1839 [Prochlorococcus sp. MIT 0703]